MYISQRRRQSNSDIIPYTRGDLWLFKALVSRLLMNDMGKYFASQLFLE